MKFAVSQRQAVWLVAGLTLVGAYLRLFNLGELGFRWDEDLSGLTVQAILKHGIPELPSGMLYLRGLGLSYLMAGSASLLGFSEFALRLPSALFGIATIPLCYLFARRLFSIEVGVLAAGMFTLSFWDIEMARYARMYAPFGFFYLLTLYCIWRFRVEKESLWGGCLCIALAVVAVSLQRLGFTLAFALLIPELLRLDRGLPRPGRLAFAALAFVTVAAFFWFWKEAINDNYARFSLPMWQTVEEGASLVRSDTGEVSLVPPGPLGNEIAVPQFQFLIGLWTQAASIWVLLAGAVGVALGATLWRQRREHDWLQRVLLIMIAASCLLPLFNVAILGLATAVFARRQGIGVLGRGDLGFAALGIGAAFAVWLGLGLFLDLGGHAADGPLVALRRTVKELLDYPRFFIFWGFAKEWPVMTLAALLGGLWAMDRAAREPLDRPALFLLLAFAIPLTLNGLLRIPYELFRYNIPLDPLFFTFVGLGLLHGVNAIRQLFHDRPIEGGRAAALLTAALAAMIVLTDLNPVRSWLVTVRGYQSTWLQQALSVPPFPDFKTPAVYVRERATDEDLIFVLDSREIYNYLGRADYWVYSAYYEVQTYQTGNVIRDKYVSTPLIKDLQTLQGKLNQPGTRKWLIASDRMLAAGVGISPQIKDFISNLQDHVVYVGRDGANKVYMFDDPTLRVAEEPT